MIVKIKRMKRGYTKKEHLKSFASQYSLNAYIDKLVSRMEKRGFFIESGFLASKVNLIGAYWIVYDCGDNYWEAAILN